MFGQSSHWWRRQRKGGWWTSCKNLIGKDFLDNCWVIRKKITAYQDLSEDYPTSFHMSVLHTCCSVWIQLFMSPTPWQTHMHTMMCKSNQHDSTYSSWNAFLSPLSSLPAPHQTMPTWPTVSLFKYLFTFTLCVCVLCLHVCMCVVCM